jgi:GNAT superfamily N-acetyltransferase
MTAADMTAAEIITAGPADLDVLSEVIAEAFFDLPPSPWLIADPDARRKIFPPYFRLILDGVMAAGVVQTNAARTAAALWQPAGEPAQHTDAADAAGDYPAALAAITGPWAGRFGMFDATLESTHPAGRPHHHLAILAVRPACQGQGEGTALLRAFHQALNGKPAYLEAASQRTRKIYLQHGYADHGPPIQLPDGGPQMFPMWRQP